MTQTEIAEWKGHPVTQEIWRAFQDRRDAYNEILIDLFKDPNTSINEYAKQALITSTLISAYDDMLNTGKYLGDALEEEIEE